MQIKPFQHMTESPFRKISSDDPGLNFNRDLVLTVYCVKMRWWMFPWEYPDHNSKKS